MAARRAAATRARGGEGARAALHGTCARSEPPACRGSRRHMLSAIDFILKGKRVSHERI